MLPPNPSLGGGMSGISPMPTPGGLPQPPMSPAPPSTATAMPPTNALVTISMTEDERRAWKSEIDRANTRRKIFEQQWERNLSAYSPEPTNVNWGQEINPGIDFYQTEQKKAVLFYETPTIVLVPNEDTPTQDVPAIAAWQAKINKKLGPKGLNCERLMDKVLFSILCTAGLGCTKLGVTRITKDVPAPADPMTGQVPMDEQGNPQTVPVPVYQEIFWEQFSPKKVLIPTSFHDSEFDKAPWLGMRWTMPTRVCRRQFNLPPDYEGKSKEPNDQVFETPGVTTESTSNIDQSTGVALFYRASQYDDNVFHPDHMRELVFVDGLDDPVVHRDSPYQTFDQNGTYQADDPRNLVGNPIHLFTIRDLEDSPFIPSDSTMTRPLVNEISHFRTQLTEQRDSSTSVRLADEKIITPEILAKVVRSPWGAILLVPDLEPSRPPMIELAKSTYPRESFTAQDIIERDLAKITTLGSNQLGVEQNEVRSATESAFIQQNSNTRQSKERNRTLACFTKGVEKIDALMKRFELPPGQQPVNGYEYDIKPDSGIHVDAAAERKFALDRYNMLAKDPDVSREYLLRDTAPKLHLDPAQLIVQPPPPHPEPPKISFIVKGEDISPLAPQYPNMLEVMKLAGINLTPQPITDEMVSNAAMQKPIKQHMPPPQAPHPGTASQADTVSKKQAGIVGHPANIGGLANRSENQMPGTPQ